MSMRRQATLLAFLMVSLAAACVLANRAGLIAAAEAQSEAEKHKKEKEQERHKAAPPKPEPPRPGPSPSIQKVPTPPPRATAPPPPPPAPRAPLEKPQPDRPAKTFQQPPLPAAKAPPPERPAKTFEQPPSPALKSPPPKPALVPAPEPGKEGIKVPPSAIQKGAVPQKGPPAALEKTVPPAARQPSGPAGPATVAPGPQLVRPDLKGPSPKGFEDVRKGRLERVEDGRKVIQEPGNRFIVKEDNKKAIIRHDEAERFLRRPGAKTERRADGNVETYYVRPDGVRIITVADQHGRLLRRYRRDRDGHEYNIIDNRRFYRNVAIGLGVGALGIIVLNLPPPRVTIPRDRYIVEYDRASDDDLDEALTASPLEPLDRAYSLEEIRYTYELRARMRRIDLDTINFDSGAWEVPQDQYDRLERVARAILRVLRRNPEAVFLIEGHTDAVGSDEDNLSLSDRRAQSVAEILSETFDVPPENLVTQGYGEQFLKIDTPGPEPLNRRVTIVNITRLLAER
jgi:outer membrane protein OmpA-like peptidoglycan-associated protein